MLNIPFCIHCQHFHHKSVDTKTMTCKAFPDGIPGVILSNEMPHYLPVVGQVGDYVFKKDDCTENSDSNCP